MIEMPEWLEKESKDRYQEGYGGWSPYKYGFDDCYELMAADIAELRAALKAMIGAAKDKNCGLKIADDAYEKSARYETEGS